MGKLENMNQTNKRKTQNWWYFIMKKLLKPNAVLQNVVISKTRLCCCLGGFKNSTYMRIQKDSVEVKYVKETPCIYTTLTIKSIYQFCLKTVNIMNFVKPL